MSGIHTILRQLCGAFNAHDLDRIMGLFADDCILEMPRGSGSSTFQVDLRRSGSGAPSR